MTLLEARTLFPITQDRAYLFSGGISPAATPVRAALDRWSELWATDPAQVYREYSEQWEQVRRSFAAAIGADTREIANTDSTSRGSNLIVQMIEAPERSNIVVDEFTYASSFHPWRLPGKSHVEIRCVPAREQRVTIDDLAQSRRSPDPCRQHHTRELANRVPPQPQHSGRHRTRERRVPDCRCCAIGRCSRCRCDARPCRP